MSCLLLCLRRSLESFRLAVGVIQRFVCFVLKQTIEIAHFDVQFLFDVIRQLLSLFGPANYLGSLILGIESVGQGFIEFANHGQQIFKGFDSGFCHGGSLSRIQADKSKSTIIVLTNASVVIAANDLKARSCKRIPPDDLNLAGGKAV